MVEPLVDQILRKIDEAQWLYHRLVLVVGPTGSGKTRVLRALGEAITAPLINVNLELSRRMLDLTERQRALQLPRLMDEIVEMATGGKASSDAVLLDNTEILFDVHLKQDPLRLLQKLSRNRTVVASWNGVVSEGYITYAAPDHPEFRRYPAQELLIVNLMAS